MRNNKCDGHYPKLTCFTRQRKKNILRNTQAMHVPSMCNARAILVQSTCNMGKETYLVFITMSLLHSSGIPTAFLIVASWSMASSANLEVLASTIVIIVNNKAALPRVITLNIHMYVNDNPMLNGKISVVHICDRLQPD